MGGGRPSNSSSGWRPDNTDSAQPNDLAEKFRSFAVNVFGETSPLYAHLSTLAADDPDILSIAQKSPPGQPIPILLLGAVHYLLLKGEQHPLGRFFPDITAKPDATEDSFDDFRSFCTDYREAIEGLITTRRVQTNEVSRCACLLPGFAVAMELAADKPLALIEIGPSAGLNLLWDRYGYDYGEERWGNPNSPVQIFCEHRGENFMPLPEEDPVIAQRVGIDINPIDVRDRDATLWLRALIWPEQKDRVRQLEAALSVARVEPPEMLAGDALDLLPSVLQSVSPDCFPIVYHTFAEYQLTAEGRQRLTEIIAEEGARRDLARVSIEGRGWPPGLDVVIYKDGSVTQEHLAVCDQHGAWIEMRS
jgi:hypothetical protein